jgi:hypothetical protein
MKFESKSDQMYDWLKSIHNMMVGIMMAVGIGLGLLVFAVTQNWIFVPVLFVVSFAYPLAENIRRRILFRKNNQEVAQKLDAVI